MDLPPLPQRSSSPAPLPSSSKTFPAPPLLPQEAQFMCLDDDTFVGRKESCPSPPLQREEEKMLAAIYRRGGMEEEEFSVYMPSMFVPPPSLPQTIKNSFGWSAGRSIISRLARRRCRSERGRGRALFGSGVALPCIASYSSI